MASDIWESSMRAFMRRSPVKACSPTRRTRCCAPTAPPAGPTPLGAAAMLVVSLLAVVLAYVVYRALTRGEDQGSAVKQLAMDVG